MPLAFAGIIYGTGCNNTPKYNQQEYNEKNPQRIVTLNEFKGKPQIEIGDARTIYELFNLVGENPKDHYHYIDNWDHRPRNRGNRIRIEDSSVVFLYARGLGLDTLYPSIGNLENLYGLDLENNQIKTLPEEIGNLEKLKKLDLSFNKITEIPKEIENLNNLGRLVLGYNPLSQKSIELLEELKKKGVHVKY